MELTEIFEGNTSVKDLLVLTLIQKAIPMRQFELIRYIRKHHKKAIKSTGSVSVMMLGLVKQTILKVKHGEVGNTKYFYVNPEYVKYRHSVYQYCLNNLCIDDRNIFTKKMLERPFSEFTEYCIEDADKFIIGILMFLIQFSKLTKPVILFDQVCSRYWRLAENDSKIDATMFFLFNKECKENWRLDGWLLGKKCVIRERNAPLMCESIVVETEKNGKVIIELYPPTKHLKYLNDPSFAERGDYLIQVKRDDKVAERKAQVIQTELSQNLFSELVKDIVEGLRRGDEYIRINEEYVYLTPNQAKNSIDGLKLVNHEKETPELTEAMKNYLLKNLDPNKPVCIIDLGVGPAIKPVSIYSTMNNLFKVTDYVAIDASKAILELAKEDLERYNFPLNMQFLKLKFQDIAKDPNILLNNLPKDTQKFYLFMGGTYGNFPKEEINNFVNSFLKKGDIFFVNGYGFKDKKDAKVNIVGKYKKNPKLLKEKKRFHGSALREVGFNAEHFDYEYVFDEKTSTSYALITLNKVVKSILPVVLEAGLKKEQKFITNISRKFTQETLKEEMNELLLEPQIHVIKKDRYFLAMCKKVK